MSRRDPPVSRKQLSEALGISVQALGMVLRGETKSLTASNNDAAARHLGVTSTWLATGDGVAEISVSSNVTGATIGSQSVALLFFTDVAKWLDKEKKLSLFIREHLMTDLSVSAEAFALELADESMLPDFRPGDRVIVDPSVKPLPGDFVVAVNDTGTHFLKYRPRTATAFELSPLNSDYPSLHSDHSTIQIVGTMVEHRRYRR